MKERVFKVLLQLTTKSFPHSWIRNINSIKAFTLIELMVVVAIIAILAVVAIGVFNGAQASARDGKRRLEVAALAKNIESTKDPATGNYRYTSAAQGAQDYPGVSGNLPADPKSGYEYCVAGSATALPATPSAPNSGNWQGLCSTITTPATTYYNLTTSAGATGAAGASNDLQDGTIKYWKVCATMERITTPFCISSLTQ